MIADKKAVEALIPILKEEDDTARFYAVFGFRENWRKMCIGSLNLCIRRW